MRGRSTAPFVSPRDHGTLQNPPPGLVLRRMPPRRPGFRAGGLAPRRGHRARRCPPISAITPASCDPGLGLVRPYSGGSWCARRVPIHGTSLLPPHSPPLWCRGIVLEGVCVCIRRFPSMSESRIPSFSPPGRTPRADQTNAALLRPVPARSDFRCSPLGVCSCGGG